MKKALIVGMSFLLLASCASKNTVPTEVPEELDQEVSQDVSLPEEDDVNYEEALKSISSKIKTSPDFLSCMKPAVDMCVSQTVNDIARRDRSVEFCKELADQSAREACEYGVVMIQSHENGDIASCDALSASYRQQCRMFSIMQQAVSTNSVAMCDTIAQEFVSGSGVTVDENLRDMQIDQCKFSVIQSNPASTEASCSVLADSGTKDLCLLNIRERSQMSIGVDEPLPEEESSESDSL